VGLSSRREEMYHSLIVAVGSVGGGAIPYVRMMLLASLSFTLSLLYDCYHLVAFASWCCHLRTTVCIGGSWMRRLYGVGVRW